MADKHTTLYYTLVCAYRLLRYWASTKKPDETPAITIDSNLGA